MRSEPTIIVTCDWCMKAGEGTIIEVGLTALARGGYDERNLDAEIVRERWVVQGGEDICEYCWDNREDLTEGG